MKISGPTLLIRNAELLIPSDLGSGSRQSHRHAGLRRHDGFDGSKPKPVGIASQITDIRIANGQIAEMGANLSADIETIDAAGGLLLPGLHDHHIHIAATAAAMESVKCGPPEVQDTEALTATLNQPGEFWLRGIGYHESVTGALIDRHFLDRINPTRPIRIQHRTGRMWIFNSTGLHLLLAAGPPPDSLEREAGQYTGRLFDDDAYLRHALGACLPAFADIGARLASYGITGITEISPGNDDATAAYFASEHAGGALPQRIILAGRQDLGVLGLPAGITLGPFKIHLHEAHLPEYDSTVAAIRAAHERNRSVAVHCVTEVELVFTLAAFREAGRIPGDRIEHASVTPEDSLAEIAAQNLIVVTQPHFVTERGDTYRAAIPKAEWPHLYRLESFRAAGITLAAGSDSPFGDPNPWAAMHAAVTRRTAMGARLGPDEALSPEAAISLFLRDPADLTRSREISIGAPADLCLLAQQWRELRQNLSAARIRATFIGGRLIQDRIDQPQPQRGLGADTLAR